MIEQNMAERIPNPNLDDELLSGYIDGELTDEERAQVEQRLENDSSARAMVDDLRALSGKLKSLPRQRLDEDLRTAVLTQIGRRSVELPPARISMARRLMWPAIAVAAALMLIFISGDELHEIGDVAQVENQDRDSVSVPQGRGEAAFEAVENAPAEPAVPSATAPAADEIVDEETPADRMGTFAVRPAAPPEARGMEDRSTTARRAVGVADVVDTDVELGIVHLTLTDFRSGTERFNRMLISNGVQLVDDGSVTESVAGDETRAPEMDSLATEGASSAATMSTRSAGSHGRAVEAPAVVESGQEIAPTEPEMVLVEAAPEQIEQILHQCAQDMEMVKEVAVDPTAGGINVFPEKQRLVDYQQYSRAGNRTNYYVTPAQQGVISALNTLPEATIGAQTATRESTQQGWATRVPSKAQPAQLEQLNSQYQQLRNRHFDVQGEHPTTPEPRPKEALDKRRPAAEQPMRVLFMLHPSDKATVDE